MGQNKKLRLRVLSQDDSRQIHRVALKLLNKTGMDIQDDGTRKHLKEIGCREGSDGYLMFDEDTVSQALSTVPSRMVVYNQNGKKAVDTGELAPRFSPGLNCNDVLDYKTGKIRPCLLEDISKTARLCDLLPHIGLAANLGNPNDVPFDEQAMASVEVLIKNTCKPVAFTAHDEVEAGQIWQYLADVAGGWESLSSKPFGLDLTGPTSPFLFKKESCRRLRFAAARSLPVVCYPCLFPGITGPMTMAGAIAQSSAEILAGIVIHQMENPGAPVITGSAIVPMDMRTVNLSYGSPEYALACLALVDYFDDIKVPTWIGAGCSDAHIFDAQAVAEAGINMLAAALSGTSFIHNLGYLSSGKTGSLEMLLLCDELAGSVIKFSDGVPVTDNTLAEVVIQEVGKNRKYLTHPHTKKHVRNELWIPSLFQRFTLGEWRQSGSMTTTENIREKLKDLLEE